MKATAKPAPSSTFSGFSCGYMAASYTSRFSSARGNDYDTINCGTEWRQCGAGTFIRLKAKPRYSAERPPERQRSAKHSRKLPYCTGQPFQPCSCRVPSEHHGRQKSPCREAHEATSS